MYPTDDPNPSLPPDYEREERDLRDYPDVGPQALSPEERAKQDANVVASARKRCVTAIEGCGLLPRYAAHGEDPQPERHPADAWSGR